MKLREDQKDFIRQAMTVWVDMVGETLHDSGLTKEEYESYKKEHIRARELEEEILAILK